jgi:hypothetical protein
MSIFPIINFAAIRFPTDQLTVADLRRIYPQSFDMSVPLGATKRGYGRQSIEDTLGDIIDAERVIANLAFKQLLGIPLTVEEEQKTRHDHLDNLASSYIDLKLVSGEHEAMQVVREIERQAVAQAERFHGHPR